MTWPEKLFGVGYCGPYSSYLYIYWSHGKMICGRDDSIWLRLISWTQLTFGTSTVYLLDRMSRLLYSYVLKHHNPWKIIVNREAYFSMVQNIYYHLYDFIWKQIIKLSTGTSKGNFNLSQNFFRSLRFDSGTVMIIIQSYTINICFVPSVSNQ